MSGEMRNLEKLFSKPLPSTRGGSFYNTFPYPTKISPEAIHELRHALQYLHPESFDGLIARSRLYVIQYDGTCYKLVDGEWKECKLDGLIEYFTELYLGQPYEREANDFAYEKVKALLGDSPELQELHAFWTPKKPIADQAYEELYRQIDEMIGEVSCEAYAGG